MLLALMKDGTTCLRFTYSKTTRNLEIHRISDDDVLSGHDLKLTSYCRLCHTVTDGYAKTYQHSAKFRCHRLIEPIICPICNTFRATSYIIFDTHFKADHAAFAHKLWLTCWVGHRVSCQKAISMMWIVELFKRILRESGGNDKPFLPALTPGMLRQKISFTSRLCPWPVCRTGIFPGRGHRHLQETNVTSGRCNGCGLYHQEQLAAGSRHRKCEGDPAFGILPMYVTLFCLTPALNTCFN